MITYLEIGVGATATMQMKVGARSAAFTYEVTRYEANATVGFRTTEGPMGWDVTFSLQPVGEGATRIVEAGTIRLKGWQRVMEPFMGGEIRRGEQAELTRLKVLLESQP